MSERQDKVLRRKAREQAKLEWVRFLDQLKLCKLEVRETVVLSLTEGLGFRQRLGLAWKIAFGGRG